MKERLEQRLIELKNEFESGQKMLAELGTKQAILRETLLRKRRNPGAGGGIGKVQRGAACPGAGRKFRLDPASISCSLSTHVKAG